MAVRQPAVVEHLQQDIEDVRVGLLDFIQQHDRIRPAPDGLRKMAAFLVPDIAGRRTDQPCDRVFLHEFGHVDPDHGVLGIEQECGQCLRQFGLTDSGRS